MNLTTQNQENHKKKKAEIKKKAADYFENQENTSKETPSCKHTIGQQAKRKRRHGGGIALSALDIIGSAHETILGTGQQNV